MNLKKAAMFGLDARIALAIFGALSVISGAALYSAIQDAKATAIITEMKELGKAWEAYYLDTGVSLPRLNKTDTNSTNYFILETRPLAIEELGLKNWNGPYYPYSSVNATNIGGKKGEALWLMMLTTDIDWTDWVNGVCSTGRTCGIWARIYNSPEVISDSLKLAIDKKIDNSDGADKGKFRWSKTGINLLYTAIPNPIDN
jgi:hypothetical protein